MRTVCSVSDCLRETRGRQYCDVHQKRLKRGTVPLAAPVQEARTLRQTFLDAVLRYAAADSDEEFERADKNLYQAGLAYFTTPARPGVGRVYDWGERTAKRGTSGRRRRG